MAKTVGVYINADDIKRTNLCSDLEAAQLAEKLREETLKNNADFTFETVLSTDRNLNLLIKAKEQGYFIRCIYILTVTLEINIARIRVREASGGHGVPENKIRSRYEKALRIIPKLVKVCDIMHIYDNTEEPFRIFKKRKELYFKWENSFWDLASIEKLTDIHIFQN